MWFSLVDDNLKIYFLNNQLNTVQFNDKTSNVCYDLYKNKLCIQVRSQVDTISLTGNL